MNSYEISNEIHGEEMQFEQIGLDPWGGSIHVGLGGLIDGDNK